MDLLKRCKHLHIDICTAKLDEDVRSKCPYAADIEGQQNCPLHCDHDVNGSCRLLECPCPHTSYTDCIYKPKYEQEDLLSAWWKGLVKEEQWRLKNIYEGTDGVYIAYCDSILIRRGTFPRSID